MKYQTLALAFGIAIANMTFTQTASAQGVYIVGGKSCGEWIKYRQDGGWDKTVVQNWLMGYLSGIAVGARKDFLRRAEGESVYLWVDQYCNANPLDRVATAADKLVNELRKNK